jgi:hypothetical protein
MAENKISPIGAHIFVRCWQTVLNNECATTAEHLDFGQNYERQVTVSGEEFYMSYFKVSSTAKGKHS